VVAIGGYDRRIHHTIAGDFHRQVNGARAASKLSPADSGMKVPINLEESPGTNGARDRLTRCPAS
jgi:hypothetical protein